MQWEVTNGTITRRFKTLYDAGEYLGYSASWVGQRYRMNQTIEGYTITKIMPEQKSHWKKYGYRELIKKLDMLEFTVSNMQYKINELEKRIWE